MKIAIISDIHDNLANLEKCFDWCRDNEIKTAICCGDITNGETLKMINKFFTGGVFLVRGNMEIYDEAETGWYGNIKYLGWHGVAEVGGRIFGLCHEPVFINNVLKQCEEGEGCEFIFYGHTHEPWEDARQNTKVVNPGTVAGTFSKPTFAVWDTETNKVELKIIELL